MPLKYGSPPHPSKVLLFIFKAITAEGYDHSEETPLMRPTQRKRTIDAGLAIGISHIISILLTICITCFYLRKGISDELKQWQNVLKEHRLDEQSRSYEWETAFNATKERHRRQMEKWQWEEEEMQRFGLHWDEPTRDPHCTAYNTREYSAQLLNTVPYAYNWTKACEDIPIVIHGRAMKTTSCGTNKSVSCLIHYHGLKNDDHC